MCTLTWKLYRASFLQYVRYRTKGPKAGQDGSAVRLPLRQESVERSTLRRSNGLSDKDRALQPAEARSARVAAIAKLAEKARPVARQLSPPVDFRGATALVPG